MRQGPRQLFPQTKTRLWSGVFGGLVVVATLVVPHVASAGNLWEPSALFPQPPPDASNSWGVLGGGTGSWGLVPPFRAGERDRMSVGAEASAWMAGRVQLRASGEWLRDTSAAGAPVSGFGDIRLGTVVDVVRVEGLRVYAGWEVKLPNARDEGDLGTDETDVLFGTTAAWSSGPFGARASVGLAVLGNPLRFANQDDVPMLRLALDGAWGMVHVSPLFAADLATSRNPARMEAGVDIGVGRALFGALQATAGITPAAADGRAGLVIGYRGALPGPRVRE